MRDERSFGPSTGLRIDEEAFYFRKTLYFIKRNCIDSFAVDGAD